MADITAYPLSWPPGWPRTNDGDRRGAKFGRRERTTTSSLPQLKALSVIDGIGRVFGQLQAFGVEKPSIVISTNIETRVDGLPRSDRTPLNGDPGVAVYWTNPDSNQAQCMAIDLYATVAGNLAAVAATIEAMRAIERHGGAQILNRAFQGFKALPGAGGTIATLSTGQAAHLVARLGADHGHTADDVESFAEAIRSDRDQAKVWLRLAKSRAHPNAGGRNEDWTLLQDAERILKVHHGGQL